MMKRLLFVALLALTAGWATADELLQVIPQKVVAGNDGEESFVIDMRNDDNVYLALQFDLYLPDGVDLIDIEDVPIYLSEDRFTYKRGVCTTHEASVTKREGFYRVQIYGKNGNVAIPEHEGALCEVYYTAEQTLDGILPVRIENVVLGISGTLGVEPRRNVSFLYTDDVDWDTMTSLDLTVGDNVVTGDVATATRGLMSNPNTLLYVNEGSDVAGMENVVAGERCEKLVLTDKRPFGAIKAFTAQSATYSRTVAGGGWYSLCLPFAADAPEGVDVERFASIDAAAGAIVFDSGEVEADVPCIFHTATCEVAFEAVDATVTATPERMTDGALHGTYQPLAAGSITGCYALHADGSGFGQATATASCPSFRAVVEADSPARKLALVHGGQAVGVSAPQEATVEVGAVYSLDGRRVTAPLARGIYITGNKKIMR